MYLPFFVTFLLGGCSSCRKGCIYTDFFKWKKPERIEIALKIQIVLFQIICLHNKIEAKKDDRCERYNHWNNHWNAKKVMEISNATSLMGRTGSVCTRIHTKQKCPAIQTGRLSVQISKAVSFICIFNGLLP